jgi:hypothetical protein
MKNCSRGHSLAKSACTLSQQQQNPILPSILWKASNSKLYNLHKKSHMLQGKDGDNKSCGKLINIVYPMEWFAPLRNLHKKW